MAKSRNLAPALLAGLLAVALGLVAWLALGESPASEVDASTASDKPDVAGSLERDAPAVKLELDDRNASSGTRLNQVATRDESRAAVSDAAPLELKDAVWVEGSVRIPSETPLDEELEVVADGKKFPTLGHHRVRVGNDGRFRVAFSKDTQLGWLRLEGRYCFLESPLKVKPSDTPAQIVLEPTLGGCIAGVLTPPAGASDVRAVLAKARVVASSRSMEDGSTSRTASVGEDLRYELRGVPTHRTQHVEFDVLQWTPFERDGVSVEPGKVLQLDLACALGARVSGRVVDSVGAPIVNAHLSFLRGQNTKGRFGEYLRRAQSDKQGEFSIAGLRPGHLRVVVTGDGFLERELELGELVDADAREGVEIVLDSGRFVRGVVKWNSGELAAGAWVRIEEPRDPTANEIVMLSEPKLHRVDEQGRFELTGLGAGPYKLVATAPEGLRPELGADGKPVKKSKLSGPKWRAQATNVASGAELELVLTPGLSLVGAVVDELGAPITKFAVHAREARESRYEMGGGSDMWSRFEAEDGRFSLEGFAPGAWTVHATAKGFTDSDAAPVQIPHSGAPLVLALARVASVSGVVVDEDGKPIEKASVQAEWERGSRGRIIDSSAAASTNSKGEFKLRDAPAGPVTLQVRHARFAENKSTQLSLAPGAEHKGVRIVLVSGGTIRGRIHESLLVADAGWFVNMSAEGGAGWRHDQAGTDGVFRFDRVAPGKYQIHASLNRQSASTDGASSASVSSVQSLSSSVTVESGVEVEVVLGSPTGATIEVRGRVTLGGEPVADARVHAHRQGSFLSSATGADGTYAFVLEAHDGYTISASLPEGGVSQHLRVDLADGAPSSLDFEFASGRIAGRVVDAAGEPVASAWIQANLVRAAAPSTGATSAHLQSPPGGRFEFVGLAAGEYNLSVSSASFGSDAAKSFGAVVVEGIVVNEQEANDELVIRVEPPAVLNCRVRASDGSPAAGATLQTIQVPSAPAGGNFRAWQTDGAGREHIAGLSSGEYWVIARLDEQVGISASSARVRSGESREVEIELRRGGKLALTVQDAEDKPAKGRVSVVDSRGVDWTSSSSWSGTGARTFGPLPAGVYEVSASGKDLVSAVQRVNVTAGETLSVSLKLQGQ
jgi:hypothetical protein